ncbi:MAG: hypothetical protein A2V66_10425 [Ignavibacteria bacterium RBG_13_36_8]|nr:MAG: hypothetical protein A2V66_10425 [Ignavibacteria bacterium RBG_13_36_8]
MFRNYFLIALRTIRKSKLYSGINIVGLALGIACSLLIYMYVAEELSFDNYHKDVDQVYRVYEEISSPTSIQYYAPVAWPVAPTLLKDYPQVEYAARLYTHMSTRLIKYNEKVFYEPKFIYGEEDIFKILSYNFIQGNPDNALTRQNTIVITKSTAKKYFGNTNPVGRILQCNGINCEVTGVIEDLPYNTHLKFDLIASIKTIEDENWWANWLGTECFTYIKLAPNVDGDAFGEQIKTFADNYIDESFRQRGYFHRFYLQHVSDIHLKSNFPGELETPGNFYTIILFSAIGLFVLIIAGLNYMNLSTAKSLNRAKEVGLRKVVGGNRRQIAVQFYTESILLSFFALIIAFGITFLILPYFNDLSGTTFSHTDLFKPRILGGLLLIGLTVGLGAGSYPASFLSSFSPITTLGGSFMKGGKGSFMRKTMVIFQFAISLLLIIGTIVIHRQINYMQNQNLGFNKEQKLMIPVQGGASITSNYEQVKELLEANPNIVSATASSNVPGIAFYSWNIKSLDSEHEFESGVNHLFVDPDFLGSYQIEMAAGRYFNKHNPADMSDWSKYTHFIINKAAANILGFTNPNDALGLKIQSGLGLIQGEVIGVTKDFHYAGLQTAVEPLIISWFPKRFGYLTLNISTNNIDSAIDYAKRKWNEIFPGSLMEYKFLDEEFNALYNSEKQTASIVNVFTFIGLFIACLGLLGLVSFIVEQRKKEIGIRKVLGSSVSNVMYLLLKEFFKWILISNIIAWPIAYILMNSWLQDFAYRIQIELDVFVYAGLLSILLMLVTVSYQSVKAAVANPIDSIKHE